MAEIDVRIENFNRVFDLFKKELHGNSKIERHDI
jgi:hypothetical protein